MGWLGSACAKTDPREADDGWAKELSHFEGTSPGCPALRSGVPRFLRSRTCHVCRDSMDTLLGEEGKAHAGTCGSLAWWCLVGMSEQGICSCGEALWVSPHSSPSSKSTLHLDGRLPRVLYCCKRQREPRLEPVFSPVCADRCIFRSLSGMSPPKHMLTFNLHGHRERRFEGGPFSE